jgi:hypothetical protein
VRSISAGQLVVRQPGGNGAAGACRQNSLVLMFCITMPPAPMIARTPRYRHCGANTMPTILCWSLSQSGRNNQWADVTTLAAASSSRYKLPFNHVSWLGGI